MKRIPYHEGSCFAIPLRQGGYAVGVVARMAPKGKLLLAYLYGMKFEDVPSMLDVTGLQPDAAIKRVCIGDLGLINGEWPVLGDMPDWQRNDWPMPIFMRRDDLSKRAWRVYYDDADPSKLEREEPVPYDITGLESAGLYGYGAVEMLLTKLLTK